MGDNNSRSFFKISPTEICLKNCVEKMLERHSMVFGGMMVRLNIDREVNFREGFSEVAEDLVNIAGRTAWRTWWRRWRTASPALPERGLLLLCEKRVAGRDYALFSLRRRIMKVKSGRGWSWWVWG